MYKNVGVNKFFLAKVDFAHSMTSMLFYIIQDNY